MLMGHLQHTHVTATELGALAQGCGQQPWLLTIAARAMAQGTVTVSQMLRAVRKLFALLSSSVAVLVAQADFV